MKLADLEQWFKDNPPPTTPIRLDRCTVVTNPKKMVELHLGMLKANTGNATFLPYWDRLIQLHHILKNQNNGEDQKNTQTT
jgi:hypothetical protein